MPNCRRSDRDKVKIGLGCIKDRRAKGLDPRCIRSLDRQEHETVDRWTFYLNQPRPDPSSLVRLESQQRPRQVQTQEVAHRESHAEHRGIVEKWLQPGKSLGYTELDEAFNGFLILDEVGPDARQLLVVKVWGELVSNELREDLQSQVPFGSAA